MMPETYVRATMGAGGLLVLLLVIRYIGLPTAVEAFRQRLFELRRELFLFAADGRVAFDDPAYVRLRTSMNGMLRFAEQISFSRCMLAAYMLARETKLYNDHVDQVIDAHEPATRDELRRIRASMNNAVFRHMLATSPLLWLLLGVVLVAGIVYGIARGLSGVMRTPERLAARLPIIGVVETEADLMEGAALARAA